MIPLSLRLPLVVSSSFTLKPGNPTLCCPCVFVTFGCLKIVRCDLCDPASFTEHYALTVVCSVNPYSTPFAVQIASVFTRPPDGVYLGLVAVFGSWEQSLYECSHMSFLVHSFHSSWARVRREALLIFDGCTFSFI